MAEDRKDNKHHTDPIITGPPLKQPLASHPPRLIDLAETGKLPSYVAWLQLQYQQQLETAIANMSRGPMSRLAYPQANIQSPSQFLSSTAAPTGLENAYLQGNFDSPLANQQWMDSRAPQVVPPPSPGFRPGQNMLHSTELPAEAAYAISGPNIDNLLFMAKQSMINAAGGSQDNQASIDHAAGQAQFAGEQQSQKLSMLVCVVPYMVMRLLASQSLLRIVIVLLYSQHIHVRSSKVCVHVCFVLDKCTLHHVPFCIGL